ncbi:MAG: OmpA family protein [Bacteroidota bacterium]
MKVKTIFVAFCTLLQVVVFAQKNQSSGSKDFITNGGFEEFDPKSIKAAGGVQFAAPWFTPRATFADLYFDGAKNVKLKPTSNEYGSQKPAGGSSMAGFIAYTKDAKKKYRTYLEIKLNKKLEAGKKYCIKYSISLADMSKEAVNNVGIFVSEKKVQKSDDGSLDFTPQITAFENAIVKNMDGWEHLCGMYTAKGGEEYIVVGCFGAEDAMVREKVKKPAGVTGTPFNGAYYYIDNIDIVEVEAKSQCNCVKKMEQESDVIYSSSSARPPMAKPEEIINMSAVYFAKLNAEIPGQFSELMDEMIAIMKSNPTLRIELIGHLDMDEVEEAKLDAEFENMAMKRAESVKAAMVAAGINGARISVVSKDATEPASTFDSPSGHAQNRRVIFKVK